MKTILACLVTFTLGCQTTFTGDPHIDPGECQAKCQATRMEMAGMVYMGEYSSACLCEVPHAPPLQPQQGPQQGPPGAAAASGADWRSLLGAAGASGATAGVVMQMRRAQEQRNQRY